MALTFTGTGGLATRWGRIIAGINTAATNHAATLDSRVDSILSQFLADDRDTAATIWPLRIGYRDAVQGFVSDVRSFAAAATFAQVDRDTSLLSYTLGDALVETLRQLRAATQSFARPTTSLTVTPAAGNAGDALIVGTLSDGDTLPLDCVFAETVRGVVSSATGSFTDPITLYGDVTVDENDSRWPLGSGAVSSLTPADAATGTLLSNGDFETFTTANLPDGWTAATGTVGTQILAAASPKRGLANLRFSSDGATLTKLRQAIPFSLSPLSIYAVSFWAKINVVSATGTLRVALVDSTGAVIADAAAVANSVALGVNGGSGVDVTYKLFTAFFRTPALLPSGMAFEIGFTTAPVATRLIDIDLVTLTTATQLYSGGPHFAAISGTVASQRGDGYSLAVTNSLGVGSFVRSVDRLFGMRSLGLKLPTSTSSTISDALIV